MFKYLILVEAAPGRNLVANFGGLEEVHQLAVDGDLLDAACQSKTWIRHLKLKQKKSSKLPNATKEYMEM
jgi:hypothetical protein